MTDTPTTPVMDGSRLPPKRPRPHKVMALDAMTRGAYDLQQLRIQVGLRLVANFRAKLKQEEVAETAELTEEEKLAAQAAAPAEDEREKDELSQEAEKLIDVIKASYKRLTDGVARNRALPKREGFVGDELISEYTELVLVDEYMDLEKAEGKQFRYLEGTLNEIPIYKEYLKGVRGVGPAMAAVLITRLDPHMAPYQSSFWRFAGLDLGPDGRGRSRRREHLVKRTYINKQGQTAERDSITFDPWVKSKLIGVLGTSFLRTASPWKEVYSGYKHRIVSDPNRIKVSAVEWSKKYKECEGSWEVMSKYWSPRRIHMAAIRYMVKMFLAEYWRTWRTMENLPTPPSYAEAKLGMAPHGHGGVRPDGSVASQGDSAAA